MIPSAWLPLLPLAIVVAGGLALMIADAIGGDETTGLAAPAAVAFGAAGLVALGIWAAHVPFETPELLAGLVVFDRFGLFLMGTLALGGALASLLAGGYFAEHGIERGELYPLLLFSGAGAMVLAIATEMLVLFIGLETMSLAVYAMVGFRRTHPKSAEGAMKYYLLGSFGAAILLYGFALLYVVTGETQFAAIARSLAGEGGRQALAPVALGLVLVGLAFKVSAVPFHMWTPDAYEGAPTPVTAFMAVAVKAAAFAALLRFLVGYGEATPLGAPGQWPYVVALLAIATMTLGNLVAMHQTNIKRMLAYSSIAHAGYLLLGVVAAWKADAADAGRASVLYYLLAYTVSNAGAFGAVIYLGSKGAESVHLSDFAGAAKRHPGAALALALFMLSLAGVPPTAGFFGKLYVFRALMQSHLWQLVLIGLVNSAIGAYYYLYVIVVLYMKEPEPGAPIAKRMRSGYVALALLGAALVVIQMGVLPGRFLNAALSATFEMPAANAAPAREVVAEPRPEPRPAKAPSKARPTEPARREEAAAPTKGKGTVRGHVYFRGKAPAPVQVVIKGADAAKCARAREYYAREVRTGTDGGLSETLVAIEGLSKPQGWAPSEIEVEIGDCAFRPRVVHATRGDSLVISNHDVINVLPLIPDQTTPFQAAVLPGQRHPRELPRAGGFRMTDSLGHDWMYAHVLVHTHPYHVVTGETGGFEFVDIPEGAYRLNVWHPALAEKGLPFSVRAGETTNLDVVYETAAPTKAPAKAPPRPPTKAPPRPPTKAPPGPQ